MAGDETVIVDLAGFRTTVALAHTKLNDGGSWSYFICPTCARLCRTLRLFEARLVCVKCDGLLSRSQMEDKSGRIERLRALLERKHIERRTRLEASLRRAILVQRREKLKQCLTSFKSKPS
jgi:hypothetical protein